jgi:hypothetical protein
LGGRKTIQGNLVITDQRILVTIPRQSRGL